MTSRLNESCDRLPRCCDVHSDWKTLGEHLCTAFPAVPPRHVVSELDQARGVAEAFGLSRAEALDIAEPIVRHRLMLLTGEVPDGARLDPQAHVGRMASPRLP